MKKIIFLIVIVALILALITITGCQPKEEEADETKKTEQTSETEKKEETEVAEKTAFALTSSAYEDGQDMPAKYANTGVSGGENMSVPLSWEGAPDDTKSFLIAIIDRHQIANNWVHWIVINISSKESSIAEGASGTADMPAGAEELVGTNGTTGYAGPQPPPGSGAHDYETTIYALNVDSIDLSGAVTSSQLDSALEGKVIASAKLVGMFER